MLLPPARAPPAPCGCARWPTPLGRPLGQHRPPEEFGRGAVLPGVDLLPEGHDGDIPLGEVGLDGHPFLEVPAEAVQEGHHDGILGLDPGHQVLPAITVHGAAAGRVGKYQVLPDAVGCQLPELGLQVPAFVVSLADPGVAVGDWDHSHLVQQTGVFERLPIPPPGPIATDVQQLCGITVGAQQGRQAFVLQQLRMP